MIHEPLFAGGKNHEIKIVSVYYTIHTSLKSTEKMLLSIANSIHNPELIPDILNPTKLSVNFNEGKNKKKRIQKIEV